MLMAKNKRLFTGLLQRYDELIKALEVNFGVTY